MGLDDIDDSDEEQSPQPAECVRAEASAAPARADENKTHAPGASTSTSGNGTVLKSRPDGASRPLSPAVSEQVAPAAVCSEQAQEAPAAAKSRPVEKLEPASTDGSSSGGLAGAMKFLVSNDHGGAGGSGGGSSATASAADAEHEKAQIAKQTPENVESNDAQDELFQLMQKKRLQKEDEKKKKERELEKQKQKELMKEGGLFKKGFLSGGGGGGGKAKTGGAAKTTKNAPDVIDLSKDKRMADAAGGKKAAPDLTMPEVQQAMKAQLADTKSWLTPELTQVFASRPDLIQGMQNPRVQECIAMMQKDPTAAKKKFEDDKEVMKYMEEFSRLMGTHFDLMAKKAEKEGGKGNAGPRSGGAGGEQGSAPPPTATSLVPAGAPATTTAAPAPAAAGPQTSKPMKPDKAFKKAAKNMGLNEEEKRKFGDPKVQDAMMDPKVQHVIGMVRMGRPLDMREIGRNDRDLFMKLRYLIDQGILGLSA